MPSQEAVAQTVNSYLEFVAKGATEDVVALYAADGTIEDPVGSDLKRGHDAIREFYAAFQDVPKTTELVELRAADTEATFLWHLTLNTGDSRTRISPISLMTFDENAKITSMRAFWSPSDMKVV